MGVAIDLTEKLVEEMEKYGGLEKWLADKKEWDKKFHPKKKKLKSLTNPPQNTHENPQRPYYGGCSK